MYYQKQHNQENVRFVVFKMETNYTIWKIRRIIEHTITILVREKTTEYHTQRHRIPKSNWELSWYDRKIITLMIAEGVTMGMTRSRETEYLWSSYRFILRVSIWLNMSWMRGCASKESLWERKNSCIANIDDGDNKPPKYSRTLTTLSY